jgi:hypothetical protein
MPESIFVFHPRSRSVTEESSGRRIPYQTLIASVLHKYVVAAWLTGLNNDILACQRVLDQSASSLRSEVEDRLGDRLDPEVNPIQRDGMGLAAPIGLFSCWHGL